MWKFWGKAVSAKRERRGTKRERKNMKSENQKVSGVFKGYKMGTLATNGLRSIGVLSTMF